jgi:WD40 repeat protein
VKVSACTWSQDEKWIATGNDNGEIFLWNAGVPSSASFAMRLPRNRSNTGASKPITSNTITTITSKPLATTSLVFVPDSTALIIISGVYLSVWDIKKVEYVANSGLPREATNIALDGPRNRLAVAVNDRITIFDITNAVKIFDSEPYNGLFFYIYPVHGNLTRHTFFSTFLLSSYSDLNSRNLKMYVQ